MRIKKRCRFVAIGIAVSLLVMAPSASGELVESGDLFVSFDGGISPNGLPRLTQAPISIHLAGTVKTLSGDRPPALRRISIALNRGGRLNTDGLPICHFEQIVSTTSAVALAACRRALVGEGDYVGRAEFPEQGVLRSPGRILAFNSVSDGHPTVLAHVHTTSPVPLTRIIVFHIHRRPGAFGTVLTGKTEASANRYEYLRRISLRFFRRFTADGRRRSYLTAACEAPAGFPGGTFPFARASMTFVDGRTLTSTLTRSCRVRG